MRLLTWQRTPQGKGRKSPLKVRSVHVRVPSQIPQTEQDRSHLKVAPKREEEDDQHSDTDPKIDTGTWRLVSTPPNLLMLVIVQMRPRYLYVPYEMNELDVSKWEPQSAHEGWSWGGRHARASNQGSAEGSMIPPRVPWTWRLHPPRCLEVAYRQSLPQSLASPFRQTFTMCVITALECGDPHEAVTLLF